MAGGLYPYLSLILRHICKVPRSSVCIYVISRTVQLCEGVYVFTVIVDGEMLLLVLCVFYRKKERNR